MHDNPYLASLYAPVHDELVADELEVIGELPRDLRGSYVRNGPNRRYAAEGRYHWFDGDGMLHAVRFADGRASYRNRYVDTRAYQREGEAGRALWRGLMESARDNPRDAPIKDTANTDVVLHGGSLLALWYLAGEPYRIDPLTLETVAVERFGGALDAPPAAARVDRLDVSAHAKVCARSGELFFFDQRFDAPHLVYGVASAAGELLHASPVELPGPRQPHDMAITERHAILMDLPLFADPSALAVGRYKVAFHRDLPSRFAVLPRHGVGDGGGAPRWFEAEPCYIYHVTNAWEERDGREIVLVGCRVKNPEPPHAHADADAGLSRMLAYLRLDAQLYEWRFDLDSGQTRERALDDANTEFPVVPASHVGRRTRYAYHVHLSPRPTLLFDGLFKYDLQDGARSERHWFEEGTFGSEPGFAPRGGDGGAEDDGYLVTFVSDEREGRSEVQVFDARALADGPLARVKLPQRVPLGFHATWVPGV
ncbi:MAG: carotenoid oxygenase family protein [Myxococcales bacterium]|nr:carotenoid oxygenase family protein [Myxococcales bacterium]